MGEREYMRKGGRGECVGALATMSSTSRRIPRRVQRGGGQRGGGV